MSTVATTRAIVGVRVYTNQHGYLALRIHWRGRRGYVGLAERDDGEGGERRTLVEARAREIAEALKNGRPPHLAVKGVLGFAPLSLVPEEERHAAELSVGEAIENWYSALEADRPRKSLLSKTRFYLDGVILPFWKSVPLKDVTTAEVERFKAVVLSRRRRRKNRETGKVDEEPIRVKTAKNVVSGHFLAFVKWARRTYRLPEADPFEGFEWPEEKRPAPDPDPFTPGERTGTLAYFRQRKPRWSVWLNTLMWTGMRQGESTALRLRDFDAKAGTLTITKSRTEGEENAPKTKRSKRTIKLLPEALEPLRAHVREKRGLVFDPNAYLFTNLRGEPINSKEWPKKSFYPVLAKLGIRLRDFYSTRDTFISEMLRRGLSAKAVAEYCGTSVAMIERSYGTVSLDGVKSLEMPTAAAADEKPAQATA